MVEGGPHVPVIAPPVRRSELASGQALHKVGTIFVGHCCCTVLTKFMGGKEKMKPRQRRKGPQWLRICLFSPWLSLAPPMGDRKAGGQALHIVPPARRYVEHCAWRKQAVQVGRDCSGGEELCIHFVQIYLCSEAQAGSVRQRSTGGRTWCGMNDKNDEATRRATSTAACVCNGGQGLG